MRTRGLVLFICAAVMAIGIQVRAKDRSSTHPASAPPPIWNGNLCEPDKANFCLGVQGLGHSALVNCLREHLSRLTPDCRKAVSDANMRSAPPAEGGGQMVPRTSTGD